MQKGDDMKKLWPVMLCILLCGGCTTFNHTMPRACANVPINLPSQQYEVVGTLSGEADLDYFLVFPIGDTHRYGHLDQPGSLIPMRPSAVTYAKNMAVYDAIDSADGVDYLIAPKFRVSDRNLLLFRKISVNVTGKGVRVLADNPADATVSVE